MVAFLWLVSEGFADLIPGDTKTICDGLLGEALVAVELDPSFPGHREQIEDCNDDQEDSDQLPQQEGGGSEH